MSDFIINISFVCDECGKVTTYKNNKVENEIVLGENLEVVYIKSHFPNLLSLFLNCRYCGEENEIEMPAKENK